MIMIFVNVSLAKVQVELIMTFVNVSLKKVIYTLKSHQSKESGKSTGIQNDFC